MTSRVSAVLITKNEATRIRPCLDSLRWVDEIVVVDDESTDETPRLCEQSGARVLVRRSEGDFDQQRNAGIDTASGEWILQLDADEVVPHALQEEIRRVVRHPPTAVAYRIRRLNHFLGRPMRRGGWTWNEVKLFRKSSARYVGHSVHETLQVDGPVGQLASPIWHYPFQSLTQFVERQNFYTSVEARLLRHTHPTLPVSRVRRQLLARPLKLFWKSYVKKGGWREGMHGLIFAALFAWVEFLKWAKWWADGQRAEVRGQRSETVRSELSPFTLHPPPSTFQLPANGRETLSVVVLTKNEEARIARCLESVRWADELIVIDGESTDRTVEICRSFGATVIQHPFEGSFAVDRNLGLSRAQGDWVLQIDADDVATAEFRTAMDTLLRQGSPYAALSFYRRSVLLGRAMRYGGWYYTVPNLLRRGRATYEGVVHERPVVNGTIGVLAADIEHHPCEDLTAFVARHNRYTSLQAAELLRIHGKPTLRRLWWAMWRKPFKTFWKSYVKKQGYREGIHGLVFAEFFAGVEFLKWAKYWELAYTP